MTKREYIAALVLAGISSSQSDSDAVETAVERADKLLKELEKKTK